MTFALLLATTLGTITPAQATTVKLSVFDEKGAALDLSQLLARLARADEKKPDPNRTAFWALPIDESQPPSHVKLAQTASTLTATWPGGPAQLKLVWPVKGKGYRQVDADNGGRGFSDGATIRLNEEIALTQYRLFRDSWDRRTTDLPLYEPSSKAKSLADSAKKAMDAAARESQEPKRAATYAEALRLTALAWENALYEHGVELSLGESKLKQQRFGLTFDESLSKRLDDLGWLAEAVDRSGSNWVRLVFRSNDADFAYASLRSFDEYDAVCQELKRHHIKVMGTLLDIAQWPKTLTPEAYTERVKNIVLHYKGRGLISSWEVGRRLNGDWQDEKDGPLSLDRVFEIDSAAAARAKQLDPETETVATLEWRDATAPDREHSLPGWLKRYCARGFGANLDVIGLDFFPEDNPVGMALEQAFETVSDAAPGQKLMLSSLGYVDKDPLKGYWLLSPTDADAGRKDLVTLATAASCAMRDSVCGGFWWQTLEQMLPPGRRNAFEATLLIDRYTELFKADLRTLADLGREQ